MSTIRRRALLKSSFVAAGMTIVPSGLVYAKGKSPATSVAANEKLNIAGIGVGGQGGSHVGPSLRENLVAICDASEASLHGCLGHAERLGRNAHAGTVHQSHDIGDQPALPLAHELARQVLEDHLAGGRAVDAEFLFQVPHADLF